MLRYVLRTSNPPVENSRTSTQHDKKLCLLDKLHITIENLAWTKHKKLTSHAQILTITRPTKKVNETILFQEKTPFFKPFKMLYVYLKNHLPT